MNNETEINSSPMRRKFTNQDKIRYVNKFEKSPGSLRAFCVRKKISSSTFYYWKKMKIPMMASKKYGFKIKADYKPYYANIEENLCGAILDARSDGIPVNYKWIQRKARELNESLSVDEKHENPKFTNGWVRKFLLRFDFVNRKKTSSRNPAVAIGSVIDNYKEEINRLVINYNIKKENIFNMDETGVYFDMSPDYTIDKLGTKTVSIVSNSCSKQRFTCVLTIRGDGSRLKPMILFKGKNSPKRIIIPSNIQSVDAQLNAWMDTKFMLQYVESLPCSDEPKLLIMDAFAVHKKAEVLEKLMEKNFHVVFVPAGFTDLLQPLDVAIMRPFKSAMREYFCQWSYTQEKVKGRLPIPSKNLLVQWVESSFWNISSTIIENSFPSAEIDVPAFIDYANLEMFISEQNISIEELIKENFSDDENPFI